MVRRTDVVDRVIVHQFDPARPSPGGIDSCLRGIAKYLPAGQRFFFVGVDTGGGPKSRKLGRWESYRSADGTEYKFMPVVKLDPAVQKRAIPHSLRLVVGVLRYLRRIPPADWFQAHRMDTAWALRPFLGRRSAYFIHTQENGLTGKVSDSFWKLAGRAHQALERSVVGAAQQVVVFNETYSDVVRRWNPAAMYSPTWFDPELINAADEVERDEKRLIWVGRLEVPKDPGLAVEAFARLVEIEPSAGWSLDILGSGTLMEAMKAQVAALPDGTASRVRLLGRVAPEDVAQRMAQASVFLMTSHPGYEGYPRVLVEALASGLPAVVTEGSDTGGLISPPATGYVTGRSASEIAERIREAVVIDRASAKAAVASLGAPAVTARIYEAGQ